jgi:DNA modification methylase
MIKTQMYELIHANCIDVLRNLPDNSVDCIVTDPPYGYSFMGKDWDKAVPSVETWRECLRVLKPGAFAFIMSAPRQDVLNQMIMRIGEAGFDTDFTSIYWTYASGFPKAMNVGKRGGPEGAYGGFQPKPAVELIIVAMKPLSEKTFVDQALKNGKGITWLDDCRVPAATSTGWNGLANGRFEHSGSGKHQPEYAGAGEPRPVTGRFPANLLVSDDVLNDGMEKKSGALKDDEYANGKSQGVAYGDLSYGYNFPPKAADTGSYSRYFDLDAWAKTFPFLIVPKASKSEKNNGLENFELVRRADRTKDDGIGGNNPRNRTNIAKLNHHPTVKPLKLMAYLVTLGSRAGDVVLDPFLGSGTTALAAHQLNRQFIGIEREGEYVEIARARLAALPKTQPNLFGENQCSTSKPLTTKNSKQPEKTSTPVFGTWSSVPFKNSNNEQDSSALL